MITFTIAAAQISSIRGDISTNITKHIKVIEQAIYEKVDFIVFPELSLTGYELDLAKQLALSLEDTRLNAFRKIAREGQITIAVGAPINGGSLPFLSEIIFSPDGTSQIYAKINVHHSEQPYFRCGQKYNITKIAHHRIANAICADITVQDHIKQCIKRNASIYAAGAYISEKGYSREANTLQNYSETYRIPVLLANYPQSSERYDSAGQSSVWINGKKLISTNKYDPSLIVAKEQKNEWHGKVIHL